MTSLSYLALLVFAFLGIDVSEGGVDSSRPDCPIIDYSENWYAWEDCLIPDHHSSSNYNLSKDEWRVLVEKVWADYQPWMRAQLASAHGGWSLRRWHGASPRPRGAPDDWTPTEWVPGWDFVYFDYDAPLPKLVHGKSAVAAYCSASSLACFSPGGWGIHVDEVVGRGTWVVADGTTLRFDARRAEWTIHQPARIALPTRGGRVNRFTALHELAHAINSYRDYGLYEASPPQRSGNMTNAELDARDAARQERYERNFDYQEKLRTNSHELAFRCLALDLYRAHTDAVPDDAYEVLNGLCRLYAPGYATPHQSNSKTP